MLPTPSTDHVDFERIYEPAEDSYLLLDTLSLDTERSFLASRFPDDVSSPTPLVLEVGTGSGVVLSFIHAHAGTLFGGRNGNGCDGVLTLGVDVNSFACIATAKTISIAQETQAAQGLNHGFYLGSITSDLTSALRPGQIDVLVFNPPYVPTPELPRIPERRDDRKTTTFDEDSHLLELSYAGGEDGMETTDRLLDELPGILSRRGCAYVLLCAQNKPEGVKERIRGWGRGWEAETVGRSGKLGGWEKLVVIRIWRDDGDGDAE